MSKPIGEIVGDMAAMLFLKNVINLKEFKQIIGEDRYKDLFGGDQKEAADNDDK